MATEKQSKPIWVVVKVEAGIPVLAEVYFDKQSARRREQLLRKFMHPENDETGVFETQVRRSRAAISTAE